MWHQPYKSGRSFCLGDMQCLLSPPTKSDGDIALVSVYLYVPGMYIHLYVRQFVEVSEHSKENTSKE